MRIPAANVVEMLAKLTLAEAAALPLAGLTAYRALVTRAELRGVLQPHRRRFPVASASRTCVQPVRVRDELERAEDIGRYRLAVGEKQGAGDWTGERRIANQLYGRPRQRAFELPW